MLARIQSKFYRKKCLLVLGGSGRLGARTVNKFVTGPLFRKWRVFNIDLKPNPQATSNFIVDPSKPIGAETISQLHSEIKAFDEEFEMMINLAGHYYPPNSEYYLKSLA